jgi:hypothetical protein
MFGGMSMLVVLGCSHLVCELLKPSRLDVEEEGKPIKVEFIDGVEVEIFPFVVYFGT